MNCQTEFVFEQQTRFFRCLVLSLLFVVVLHSCTQHGENKLRSSGNGACGISLGANGIFWQCTVTETVCSGNLLHFVIFVVNRSIDNFSTKSSNRKRLVTPY